jgi:hypothetical protein
MMKFRNCIGIRFGKNDEVFCCNRKIFKSNNNNNDGEVYITYPKAIENKKIMKRFSPINLRPRF